MADLHELQNKRLRYARPRNVKARDSEKKHKRQRVKGYQDRKEHIYTAATTQESRPADNRVTRMMRSVVESAIV